MGINGYVNSRALYGAVTDAMAMKAFLERSLGVPEANISTLFDEEATREAILQAFQKLRDDQRIKKGDAIVIFFAGHGGELKAPPCWGIETKIQCLIPHDYKTNNVSPIPDRTIAALIDDIARVKGDNICLIFDCCYSASCARQDEDNDEEFIPRSVEVDMDIHKDLDNEIWGGRAGTIPQGFAHRGARSHVLLASCGESELSYEYRKRGQFTDALLSAFKSCAIKNITYAEVIRCMRGLDRQNPHCVGINQHRILFDVRVRTHSRVHYDLKIVARDKYVIDAGLAHGISPGVEFTLYDDKWRVLGAVVVDDTATVEDFRTILTIPGAPFNGASIAKLTRVCKVSLYLDQGRHHPGIERILQRINDANFQIIPKVEDAKLEVAIEKNMVDFKVLDQRLIDFQMTRLPYRATLHTVGHILNAAAHFYWFLDLTNKNSRIDASQITVDLYGLEDSYDELGMAIRVPEGPGLCRKDPSLGGSDIIDLVVKPGKAYGLEIKNKTGRNLYLNAFLFNNGSLSIVPYYIQSSAGTPEAPLKQKGTLTIGYGPGETSPFDYTLNEGQNVDVGYLKLFLATRPIDLTDLVQTSPFKVADAPEHLKDIHVRDGGLIEETREPRDIWFTLKIPIVQRRT